MDKLLRELYWNTRKSGETYVKIWKVGDNANLLNICESSRIIESPYKRTNVVVVIVNWSWSSAGR